MSPEVLLLIFIAVAALAPVVIGRLVARNKTLIREPTQVLLKVARGPFGTKLFIDGKTVRNCREVIIRSAAGDISTVTLTLVNIDAAVEGEAEVINRIAADPVPETRPRCNCSNGCKSPDCTNF